MSQVAKLFMNGGSQAVRLPAAYRFDAKEVFIRQDPSTGNVILSRRPSNWDTFLVASQVNEMPVDFLVEAKLYHGELERDIFGEWQE